MIIDEDSDHIAHIGILRKSGRYPWGSGKTPYQRHKSFLNWVDELHKEGMTEVEIARAFGMYKDGSPAAIATEMRRQGKSDIEIARVIGVNKDISDGITTSELRTLKSIAKSQTQAEDRAYAQKLKNEKQMSTVAIAKQLDMPESSVRALLKPSENDKHQILVSTAEVLKNRIDETDGFIDIGKGSANYLGISAEKLAMSAYLLQEDGYKVFHYQDEQAGTGHKTNTKILAKPGTKFNPDVTEHPEKIQPLMAYSEDGGRSFKSVKPPVAVDPKRVVVRYGSEGGADKDGVIELRRGVDDLSLGSSRYAQVRVKVGPNHYLKGMAMYSDDLPDGVDIIFNTNKENKTGSKLDAMKEIKKTKDGDEAELPFGSIIRQKDYTDSKTGKTKLSPLNIVGSTKRDEQGNDISYSGEEGAWAKWGRTLSSQMLSKQKPELAREQLAISADQKKQDLDEILALNNPVIKKKLLDAYADGADSSARHLKAAGLPRTASHVILPINSLKDNEIFAPNYKNGERVVLIRHPHGGIFEIPELVVNNGNREANRLIKQAVDAVGINSRVAGRLSGADFDGDTVLVIPNPQGRIRTKPPLPELKNFEPQKAFPPYDGMKTIDGGTWNASTRKVEYGSKGKNPGAKQTQMGIVSNLITDMTIKGASDAEIARAVKHSMVVIDAEKHSLDYKNSAKINGVTELMQTYQRGPRGGADTLISKAKNSEIDVPQRKKTFKVNPDTGEREYTETGASYVRVKTNKRTGLSTEEIVYPTTKVKLMDEVKDARDLISGNGGTVMEHVYADHANKLKGLANEARRVSVNTPGIKRNPSAAKTYAAEVESLSAKLEAAIKNAPLERQAQRVSKVIIKTTVDENPDLDKDGIKKIKAAAITEARARVGATKPAIRITPREWEAIQADAITNNMLKGILDNADLDQVKELATPRAATVMVPAKVNRAKALLAKGYDYTEIAGMLGVPTSTLHSSLEGK